MPTGMVLTSTVPPSVVILNPPAWMNDQLRARIEQVATPVTPRSSLNGAEVKEVADSLAADAWVKKVRQVRRVYGNGPGDTLEVDCEFRAPVALVQDDSWFWMVDADGVKLPERFMKDELAKVALGTGLQGIQLRIIVGERAHAPQAGEKWQGDDLKAGLELAKLFHGKTYLDEIAMIDVSGVEPASLDESHRRNEIALYTKRNTQIIWGEPIPTGPFRVDVPVEQKLMTLERLYERFGRCDAGRPWLQIRYDSVLYKDDPNTESATTSP